MTDAESIDGRPASPSGIAPFDLGRPKPFSPETLAERWGCSAEKIRQMFHQGELAGFRLGKLIRIPANEVERFEAACTQSPVNTNSFATVGNTLSQSARDQLVVASRLGRLTMVTPAQ
jgi:excisionase family DNA binding protein